MQPLGVQEAIVAAMARSRKASSVEKAFAGVLRDLREAYGLSQERLGHDAGSGRTYISQLERGEKSPSLKMVFRLAVALEVTPEEIVRRVRTLTGI